MIKDLQAHKTARRELAVESGYAEFKEVTVKEHIRKEHIQNRLPLCLDPLMMHR
jgi:hypothetical protein